jgi:hypothetical protein
MQCPELRSGFNHVLDVDERDGAPLQVQLFQLLEEDGGARPQR